MEGSIKLNGVILLAIIAYLSKGNSKEKNVK